MIYPHFLTCTLTLGFKAPCRGHLSKIFTGKLFLPKAIVNTWGKGCVY